MFATISQGLGSREWQEFVSPCGYEMEPNHWLAARVDLLRRGGELRAPKTSKTESEQLL